MLSLDPSSLLYLHIKSGTTILCNSLFHFATTNQRIFFSSSTETDLPNSPEIQYWGGVIMRNHAGRTIVEVKLGSVQVVSVLCYCFFVVVHELGVS